MSRIDQEVMATALARISEMWVPMLSERPGVDRWRRFAWSFTGAFAVDQVSKWMAVLGLAGRPRGIHIFPWLHLWTMHHDRPAVADMGGLGETGQTVYQAVSHFFTSPFMAYILMPMVGLGAVACFIPKKVLRPCYSVLGPVLLGSMLSHVVELATTGGAIDWIGLSGGEPGTTHADWAVVTNFADIGIALGSITFLGIEFQNTWHRLSDPDQQRSVRQ